MHKIDEATIDSFRRKGYSDDLLPKQGNWSALNYFTLWQGSVHNVPNYLTIGGFLILGVSTINILAAIIISGFIIAALMILNGQAGSKYHIPFAMLLRASYGVKGALLPGILRGIIAAIMWFGLQNFLGSVAVYIVIAKIWPAFLELGGTATIFGLSYAKWIAFLLFCCANILIGLGGGNTLKRFTGILNPCIYIVFCGMAIWGVYVGGGINAILSYTSNVIEPKGGTFYTFLFIINATVAVWAAPIVSASDFTQNSKSLSSQALGQFLGLGVAYIIFAMSSICILAGASIHYGTETWDVLTIIQEWNGVTVSVLAGIVIAMTTISTNATGNIIPAAYQIMALFPKLTYKKGVIIASIISILICPWKLVEQQESIFAFLAIIGGTLGPVIGVMLAHYYFIIRGKIRLDYLYIANNQFSYYPNGFNSTAFIATIVAILFSLLGNQIPGLSFIDDFTFVIGIVTAFVVYLLLSLPKVARATYTEGAKIN